MTQIATHTEQIDPSTSVSIVSGLHCPRNELKRPPQSLHHTYRNTIVHGVAKAGDVGLLVLTMAIGLRYDVDHLFRQQVRPLEVACLVGGLLFLLWPKANWRLDVPLVFSVTNHVRYLISPLLVAGAAGVAVLGANGWKTAAIANLWGTLWFASVAAIGVGHWGGLGLLRRLQRSGSLAQRVAIIGGGDEAQQIAHAFRTSSDSAFHLVGIFDDGSRKPHETPVQGSVSDLIAASQAHRFDAVIIALPQHHKGQVTRLIWRLRSMLADIYITPQLVGGINLALPIKAVGPVPVMVVKRRPLSETQMVAKSAFDFIAGAVVLLLILPALLLVAALIKLESRGPILFRQQRLGYNNRYFTVFKFRSMYANMADPTAMQQTARGDPRVTRVGKWIRRLSIDELPQLLNVIRGEMSLVGPRPHAPHTRASGELLHDALPEYAIRHQVKPGITGWAQVNGSRGELVTLDDLRRRVELDLEYIQRWSLWFDIKIMVLTVSREILSRHAF